jgi:hypothetical protein
MTTAAFALSTLFASTAMPKEPGPPERDRPGARPARPAPPPHARGDEKRGEAGNRKKGDEQNETAKDDKQAERRQTRDLRRKAHRQKLLERLGAEGAVRPPILAELKTHAWRMARLERLRALAEALEDSTKRTQTIERIDKLVARETKRHERQLEQLKSQARPSPEKPADQAGGGK